MHTPSTKYDIDGTAVHVVNNINQFDIIRSNLDQSYLEGHGDDAFFVCNVGDILRKHKIWLAAFPRIEPFYAVKCNPQPLIIELLSKLNVNFDCASQEEISQVLKHGVPSNRIIFANPCKRVSHLVYARQNNVDLLTFDSIEELIKTKQHFPESQLVLRIFVGATKALCPLGLKFGAKFNDIPEILETAASLNISVVGVSFHVGSGCFDETAYEIAIKLSREVFNLAHAYGFNFHLLDIGGGFPGSLDSFENMCFFEKVAITINNSIDQYFSDINVRIIAEPGRFYVASAYELVTSVTSIRSTFDSDAMKYSYFLNEGLYGSFNCIVFDHYICDYYVLNDSDDHEMHPSVFWGPTCDSADKILDGFKIKKLSIGDIVVFRTMGAYSMAAASSFNGFELSKIKYYSSESDWDIISGLVEYSHDASLCTSTEIDDIIQTDQLLYIPAYADVL